MKMKRFLGKILFAAPFLCLVVLAETYKGNKKIFDEILTECNEKTWKEIGSVQKELDKYNNQTANLEQSLISPLEQYKATSAIIDNILAETAQEVKVLLDEFEISKDNEAVLNSMTLADFNSIMRERGRNACGINVIDFLKDMLGEEPTVLKLKSVEGNPGIKDIIASKGYAQLLEEETNAEIEKIRKEFKVYHVGDRAKITTRLKKYDGRVNSITQDAVIIGANRVMFKDMDEETAARFDEKDAERFLKEHRKKLVLQYSKDGTFAKVIVKLLLKNGFIPDFDKEIDYSITKISDAYDPANWVPLADYVNRLYQRNHDVMFQDLLIAKGYEEVTWNDKVEHISNSEANSLKHKIDQCCILHGQIQDIKTNIAGNKEIIEKLYLRMSELKEKNKILEILMERGEYRIKQDVLAAAKIYMDEVPPSTFFKNDFFKSLATVIEYNRSVLFKITKYEVNEDNVLMSPSDIFCIVPVKFTLSAVVKDDSYKKENIGIFVIAETKDGYSWQVTDFKWNNSSRYGGDMDY